MISKLFIPVLTSIAMFFMDLPLSVAAIQVMTLSSSPEPRPDHSQIRRSPLSISGYGISNRNDFALRGQVVSYAYRTFGDRISQERHSLLTQNPAGTERRSLVADQRQLVAQLPQREKENSEGQLSHELTMTKNSLQQAKQRIDELERQLADGNLETVKRRIGELVIQLHAKESEIAVLRSTAHENSKKFREDLALQVEELNQAKRRVAEVEQQMAGGKGQELAQAKRRVAEVEQQTARKEQELAQAKRRVAELEQQTTGKEQEVSQAKRRVAELEQQMVAKEYESAQAKRRANEFEQQMVGKDQDLSQVKRRVAEAEQQTAGKEQELAQAKRRVAELEQQTAGKVPEPAQVKRRIAELEQQVTAKEQELTQAKRRVAEIEQQMAGKEQDPAQIKRRVTELEQQMVGKEQELVQVRDSLKQVTQKYADLGPLLMDRDAELARMKQSLEDLERSLPKPEEALPSLEVRPVAKDALSELPPDANISVSDLPLANPSHVDGADTVNIDLAKVSETFSSKLGEEIKRGSVALRQERATLTLTLVSSELFPPDDAIITPGGNSLIGQIGSILQTLRYRTIEVTMHTDNKPIRHDSRKMFRDNVELSRARVEHASQALINSGIDADRVKPVVYTSTKPTAANDTPEGRNKNKRVEIVVSVSEAVGHPIHGRFQPAKKSPQSISLSSPRRP